MTIYVDDLAAIPPEYKQVFDYLKEVSLISDTDRVLLYGEPNCYKCQYRRCVPSSAHSKCNFIYDTYSNKKKARNMEMVLGASIMLGVLTDIPVINVNPDREADPFEVPLVGLHRIGLGGSWALWPVDFDPNWILWCLAYHQPKEDLLPVDPS